MLKKLDQVMYKGEHTHVNAMPFATENTEFTEKSMIKACLDFLGVLGDLCGDGMFIACQYKS
jgi:hypothetical protein